MRLSQKKRSELYEAISEPIMRQRIEFQRSADVLGEKNAADIDDRMHRLQNAIWREVHKALNLDGPA